MMAQNSENGVIQMEELLVEIQRVKVQLQNEILSQKREGAGGRKPNIPMPVP